MPNWTNYHENLMAYQPPETTSWKQLLGNTDLNPQALQQKLQELSGITTFYTGRSFTSKTCDYCKSKHFYSTSQCPNCGAFL